MTHDEDPSSHAGLLVIDKPSGPTSHDVVVKVRRLFGIKRVGHAGTLDPAAKGVLLLGIGRATRLLTFLHLLPKVYNAVVQFGVTTTTLDADGEVTSTAHCSFDRAGLLAAMSRFVGEIDQVPPMVSAVKIGGEPLYRAARRGEEVERKSRRVHIYEFRLESFDDKSFVAEVLVRCSSGTYIRTMAADLGDALGCGGHLAALRRVAIGSFDETEAISLERLQSLSEPDRWKLVISPVDAMRDFPKLTVGDEDAVAVSHGRPLAATITSRTGELPVIAVPRTGDVAPHEAGMTAGVPVAVIDSKGHLLAVYTRSRKGLRPAVVLGAR